MTENWREKMNNLFDSKGIPSDHPQRLEAIRKMEVLDEEAPFKGHLSAIGEGRARSAIRQIENPPNTLEVET
jgi:hypothetical protein